MKKVKLGFVGAGYMGQLAHLPHYIESEICEVVALAETRTRLARLVAEKYHIPKVYSSHLELCQDADIEAVVEITADSEHAPVAIDLMKAGKHVLTEKPMATTLEDARKMVQTAKAKGVKLMVGYMKRYDPGVVKAKEIIDALRQSGELGAITYVRSHCFGGDWICNIGQPISTDEPRPERKRKAPSWLPPEWSDSFLGFNNVFCHNINLLRFFLGEVRKVDFVELSKELKAKVVVLNFGDFLATLETGWISADHWEEETKIYFEHGWVEVKTPPPLLRNVPAQVEVYKAGKIQEFVYPRSPWEWAFKRMSEHFLECITKDRAPNSTGSDSLKDVELMEEIFRSYLVRKGLL